MKLSPELINKWQQPALKLGLSKEGFAELIHNASELDFELLLEKMQKVHRVYENECNNPLVWLCLAGDLTGVYAFLKKNNLRAQHKDPSKRAVVHYLAWSGHIHSLNQYIIDNPDCLDTKDSSGNLINIDIFGRGIIHYLAWSGNLAALDLFLEDYPGKFSDKDKNKRAIAHYLAWSGNTWALQNFLTRHPECAEEQQETIGNCLLKAKIETPIQNIILNAMVSAIPLLQSRVSGNLQHHAHALKALRELASAGNAEAEAALSSALKTLEFKGLRQVILSGQVTDAQMLKLQMLVIDNFPGAQQLLDHYWWERSLKIQNNVAELEALVQQTSFAYLRLAEFYLAQSRKEPKKPSYGYGLGLLFTPVDKNAELLQKSKVYLDNALKHGTMGTHYVLGQWFCEQGKLAEACTHFYKAIMECGFYFKEALSSLKNLSDTVTNPKDIRCLAHIMQWRFNKKSEHLFAASEVSIEKFTQYAIGQTECTEQENLVLLSFAMTLKDQYQTISPVLLTRLQARFNIVTKDAVDFAMQLAEFFIDAQQPDNFVQFALLVIKDDNQPLLYRAALLQQLLGLKLKLENTVFLLEMWGRIDANVRNEINTLCPAQSILSSTTNEDLQTAQAEIVHDPVRDAVFEFQKRQFCTEILALDPVSDTSATIRSNDNIDDDDIEDARWACSDKHEAPKFNF